MNSIVITKKLKEKKTQKLVTSPFDESVIFHSLEYKSPDNHYTFASFTS
jgi:hypothetical protein